jgi:hypothetical protein
MGKLGNGNISICTNHSTQTFRHTAPVSKHNIYWTTNSAPILTPGGLSRRLMWSASGDEGGKLKRGRTISLGRLQYIWWVNTGPTPKTKSASTSSLLLSALFPRSSFLQLTPLIIDSASLEVRFVYDTAQLLILNCSLIVLVSQKGSCPVNILYNMIPRRRIFDPPFKVLYWLLTWLQTELSQFTGTFMARWDTVHFTTLIWPVLGP